MISILGGGVAGWSLARALVRRGEREVTVYDPRPIGSGSTAQATGGFRTQFASKLNVDLSIASRPFFANNAGFIDFRATGYAYLAESPLMRRRLSDWRKWQCAYGLPVREEQISKFFPSWKFNAETCNFCPLDGVYDPKAILQLFRDEAVVGGATFVASDGAATPETSDVIVIAAGRWSSDVAAAFALDLAIVSQRRSVWLLDGVPVGSHMPLGMDLETGWVFRERRGKLLAVAPPLTDDPTRALDQWIRRRLGKESSFAVSEQWTGWYENTFDHHPFVGQTVQSGVWASCGFSGHGIMHAPAIAESLAAMIIGDTPPIDLSDLSPCRQSPLFDPTQI